MISKKTLFIFGVVLFSLLIIIGVIYWFNLKGYLKIWGDTNSNQKSVKVDTVTGWSNSTVNERVDYSTGELKLKNK